MLLEPVVWQPYGCLHSAEPVVRAKVGICPHVHGELWELCMNCIWFLSGCKIFSVAKTCNKACFSRVEKAFMLRGSIPKKAWAGSAQRCG